MKKNDLDSKSSLAWWSALTVIPLLLAPVGCASVSVQKGTESQVLEKPQKIYVRDFAVTDGKWNVDREGGELVEFKKKLREKLTDDIVIRASKHLVPASRDENSVPLPSQNAWLITGRFTRVNQGSRLLRAAIGLGAGGTKIETEVAVYDLRAGENSQPFLTFSTTGGSGAAQAGAILGGPIGALPNAVGGATVGLTDDIRRTARETTAALSEYMYARGWVNEEERVKAKYKK